MSAGIAASGVWSIPAGTSFVDRLADGLDLLTGGDPLRLAACRVLLPTRRAGITLRDAFLRKAGGRPVLLPRLGSIGEVDADELDLGLPDGLDLPPALDGLTRQMLLAGLIAPTGFAPSAAQAAQLAAQLARLLDQVGTERLDFSALSTLAPDRYAEHWQKTLDFLKLVTDVWPAVLEERGALDPARRRDLLLQRLAAHWRQEPPDGPVIAAGSTGPTPGTADLLAAIARLPQGCVILPGLDRDLPPDEWAALPPTHPQYLLKQLLDRLKLSPQQVPDWPGSADERPDRARLLSLAMAPDPTRPQEIDADAACRGLQLVTCPSPHLEAQVIALALREALEIPGKRAALVTPDRDLARRVAAELHRLGVDIDDSAGQPLATTLPGSFLRLISEAVADDLAPAPLLALLKHPLAALGQDPVLMRRRVRRLELLLLRGPRPAPGLAGLRAACRTALAAAEHPPHGRPPHPRQVERLDDAARLIEDIGHALGDFSRLLAAAPVPLADLVAAHLRAGEALAATADQPGAERLWAGVAGAGVADFVASLHETAPNWLRGIAGADYPALFGTLLAAGSLRPPYGKHPRLAILGPIEAQLQQVDRLVLGGLNEGIWPAEPGDDPWMSRPMRADFGLPPLERRIGQAAHDFSLAFCAPDVILTRAERVEGTPTVPSRWLQRLAVALEALAAPPLADAGNWLALARTLDAPPAYRAAPAPQPRPPLAARPRRLSVTRIETLRRDPYAIYAQYILKLTVLEPLDKPFDPAERGTILHKALEDFVRAFPGPVLPPDAADQLLAAGRAAYGDLLNDPAIERFWWPQFERLADWIITTERTRRAQISRVHTEAQGALTLSGLPGGDFRLEGRADRVEQRRDGTLAIIDYKSGQPPSLAQVKLGYAPQLPLLGAIAAAGGFTGIAAGDIAALEFWRIGSRPEIRPLTERGREDADFLADLIPEAEVGLRGLLAYFDNPATPYLPQVKPGAYGGDYDHLARVREWAGEDDA